jgi:hypothetical protein
VLLTLAFPLSGQLEETDPYSINFVQRALNLHEQGIHISIVDKRIPWRGDETSIALLKIFSEEQLSSPQVVATFLPLIQESFSEPQSILVNIDKKPRVTLFLLKYLQRSISDAQTQRNVEETIKFVEEKTTPN